MRMRLVVLAVVLVSGGLGTALAGQESSQMGAEGMQVRVTAKELAELPANPLIYGNFIESGFGRQVEGMWAEMLFNRSFEVIPPYTRANYASRGCGPETDVERQPWWHSGYEEPPWELVSGNEDARWSILEHSSFWKGQRAGWLRNESGTKWAGVAQGGMYLRKGEKYHFSGMLRTGQHAWDMEPDDRSIEVEVRLYAEGDWSTPIRTHRLTNIRKAFERHECALENPDFEGRAVFSLWIPPESNLGLDDLSLMPASSVSGWRADVIAAARQVNARMLRWPGGCYASFYHWRDGVGPRSQRQARESPFWGGLYDNDVGTREFVEFCRLVDAEPFICVNVMTAEADEAAEWVAYCNASAAHPVGALRARDGHTAPLGVKYWELDNETNRRFTGRQYAQRCVEFARAMKAVDPTIEIAMVGYDWYRLVLREMLDVAGRDIDYVVDRAIDEPTLRHDLDVIRGFNQANGTNVRLCNTEWPAPEGDVPPTVDAAALEQITTAKGRRRCWYSALNVAKTLLTFQRLGGDFVFANFNNYVNTWGQNVIEAPKEAAYLAPVGHVFELFSRSPAARPLELEIGESRAHVVVQGAWNEARTALCLVVLNYNAENVPVRFSLADLGQRFTRCATTILRAESLTAYNTPARRCVVERTDTTSPVSESGEIRLTVPPYGLVHAVVE